MCRAARGGSLEVNLRTWSTFPISWHLSGLESCSSFLQETLEGNGSFLGWGRANSRNWFSWYDCTLYRGQNSADWPIPRTQMISLSVVLSYRLAVTLENARLYPIIQRWLSGLKSRKCTEPFLSLKAEFPNWASSSDQRQRRYTSWLIKIQ